MSAPGFWGMLAPSDYTADERPTNYREGLLYLNPNGDVVITGFTGLAKSKKLDDQEFKYFERDWVDLGAAVTGLYKEAALTTAFTNETGAVGLEVYAKMAEAGTLNFRPGYTVKLFDISISAKSAFGKVESIHRAGANSYVCFTLKTTTVANELQSGVMDYLAVAGDANVTGSYRPVSHTFQNTTYEQYMQTFRAPIDVARSTMRTHMRIGDPKTLAKQDALMLIGRLMEIAFLTGEKSRLVGDNGKYEYTCMGFEQYIADYAAGQTLDYRTSFGVPWIQSGEQFIDESLAACFTYGRDTKLALCGAGAMLGIARLAKTYGHFTLTADTLRYGVKVVRWQLPFGEVLLKRHPLMSKWAHRTNSMFIMEPENVEFAYLDDIFLDLDEDPKKTSSDTGYDGIIGDYRSECAIRYYQPQTGMILHGVGLNP